MKKTAEAVSIGHPDKIADYISSHLLDCFVSHDPAVKFAVEVLIKDNTVVLGGEIDSSFHLTDWETPVKEALRAIGYDERYADIWQENAIDIRRLNIINLIGQQSHEINQGVLANGWGDQGVFVGYACQGEGAINRELFLATQLNKALYEMARKSDHLGLDIKTQITLSGDEVETAIVAIPMLKPVDLTDFIIRVLGEKPDRIIVNGTGAYTRHSSVADCGITGRKLACDFYSTACPIGGGSPWTKDASKADLTLNLYARKLALAHLKDNEECFVYLSSCIGQAQLPSAEVKTIKNGVVHRQSLYIDKTPAEIIAELGLNKPIFTDLCRQGLMYFQGERPI